ncbi:MAG: hypothetical protein K1X67_14195 [Fimbriimonadaceae bacterium]|nr:hypothetical protein [Fimbriimonadaceae bacterium]
MPLPHPRDGHGAPRRRGADAARTGDRGPEGGGSVAATSGAVNTSGGVLRAERARLGARQEAGHLYRIGDLVLRHCDFAQGLQPLQQSLQFGLGNAFREKGCDRALQRFEGTRLRISALLQVGDDEIDLVFPGLCGGSSYRLGLRLRIGFGSAGSVGALELTFLIEDDLEFLFQRHAAEQRVDRLAAGDAVVVGVASAIGTGDEVFNAGLAPG